MASEELQCSIPKASEVCMHKNNPETLADQTLVCSSAKYVLWILVIVFGMLDFPVVRSLPFTFQWQVSSGGEGAQGLLKEVGEEVA